MTELQIVTSTAGDAKAPCPVVVPTFQVMGILRICGAELGLSAQILRTLETLLSCLAPKRNHHIVFASNATLIERSAGLSERSLRRHIQKLVEVGFIARNDSANGKRYTRQDPLAGKVIRFGLDLSPLFAQIPILSDLAYTATKRAERLRYLRCKLRAACQKVLRLNPADNAAIEGQKAARRNLSADELEAIIHAIPAVDETGIDTEKADQVTASGGQNDRHQSNFSKEHIESDQTTELTSLLSHCSEAQSFAIEPIADEAMMITHAKTLAPMIGVSPVQWLHAQKVHSERDIAALIWLMVQNLSRLLNPSGYFQAVTVGRKSASFAPWAWLKSQTRHCPRTI